MRFLETFSSINIAFFEIIVYNITDRGDFMIFKRKIYSKLLEWKEKSKGSRALLVEGARRIGKSTIVEEFAKNEYKTYILINFNALKR